MQRSHALFSDGVTKISDLNTNTTTSTTTTTMEGFSLYENSIHKASIQYPSDWEKQEIFNNDYTAVIRFTLPSGIPFAKSTVVSKVTLFFGSLNVTRKYHNNNIALSFVVAISSTILITSACSNE